MKATEQNGFDDIRRMQMLTEPVSKLIPRVALPSIINMMMGAIYNMADIFFVSKLGTSSTGAVGIVMPIMTLLQALAFMFAHGANSCVSRLLGANEHERASRVLSTAYFSAIALGIVYCTIGLLFMDPILRLFGATETILPLARQYAPYIYFASPMFAASYVLNNTLRAEGNALKSLIGMSTGAIVNIILDPIFIFVLGLGVAGGAITTMLGQILSFCLLTSFYFIKRNPNALTLSFKLFTAKWDIFYEMIRIGTPSMFRLGASSLAAVLINTASKNYGDAVIAGFSIVQRLVFFVNSALIGYGQAYQPISGYNFGAKQFNRVRDAFNFTLKSSLVAVTAASAALVIFAPSLISIFSDNVKVINVGSLMLKSQAAVFPFLAAATIFSMFFQSTGMAMPAFITATSRQGLFFIPIVLILPRIFGLYGLIASQPISDMLAFILSLILMLRGIKELRADTV